MFICVTNWFQMVDKKDVFENPGDHADEMETSLMLHLAPELVLPQKDWGDGKEFKNKIKAFSEGWAWTERPCQKSVRTPEWVIQTRPASKRAKYFSIWSAKKWESCSLILPKPISINFTID